MKKRSSRMGMGLSALMAIGGLFSVHPAQSFADSAFTCPTLKVENFAHNNLSLVKLDKDYSQHHTNANKTVCFYNTAGKYNTDAGRHADNTLMVEYPATFGSGEHPPILRSLDPVKTECHHHTAPPNQCIMKTTTIHDRPAVAVKYEVAASGHTGYTAVYASRPGLPGYIKYTYIRFFENPLFPMTLNNAGVPTDDLVGLVRDVLI